MAKKKNQSKKHKFKYGSSAGSPLPSATTGEVTAVSAKTPTAKPNVAPRADVRRGSAQPAVFVRDFGYVNQDLRRIGVLAASLVGLEVVIWLVFGHTGIGNAVYHFVQV